MRLKAGLVDEEFDAEPLPLGGDALAVLEDKARLLQQLGGFAHQRAVLAGTVAYRRHKRLAEHLVRDISAERLEQRDFLRAGLAGRHHVGVLEYRMGPL